MQQSATNTTPVIPATPVHVGAASVVPAAAAASQAAAAAVAGGGVPVAAAQAGPAAVVVAPRAGAASRGSLSPEYTDSLENAFLGLHAASLAVGWVVGVWTMAALAPTSDHSSFVSNGLMNPLVFVLLARHQRQKQRCLALGRTPPSAWTSAAENVGLLLGGVLLAVATCKAAQSGGQWLIASYPAVVAAAIHGDHWRALLVALNVGAAAALIAEQVRVRSARRGGR